MSVLEKVSVAVVAISVLGSNVGAGEGGSELQGKSQGLTAESVQVDSKQDKIEKRKFLNAVRAGRNEVVIRYLQNGIAERNWKIGDASPLHTAVKFDHHKTINLLIEHGFDKDTKAHHRSLVLDDNKHNTMTPVYYAVSCGALKSLKVLVEAGADVDMAWSVMGYFSSTRTTPLALAADKGDLAIVKYLLEHGATVNPKNHIVFLNNSIAEQPLALAVAKNNLEVVKLLIEHDAEVRDEDLGIAVSDGNVDMAQQLIDQGADIYQLYSEKSLLAIAQDNEDHAMISLLKNEGL